MISRLPKPAAMIATLALLIVILLIYRSQSAGVAPVAAKNPPVLVSTVRALKQDVPLYVNGVGTVSANATVTVKILVDGQLEKVAFKEGQDVRAGQLLAQIDARPLRAQLEQYQAQKAKDQAQLQNARLDLQRYDTLLQQNSVARQTLDTQQAQVAQLEAALKADQAQIDYETVELGYTTLRAPLSGRAGARLVDPGNIVHASDPAGLVVINQVDPIAVLFTLPEQEFQAVNQAQQNSRQALQAEAYDHNDGKVLGRGQLTMINNQIDTSSGSVQLKAHFNNPQHLLWPGQYTDVRLLLGHSAGAITVPAAAIMRGPSGTYVYKVANGEKVTHQAVTVARIQDGIAVIGAGLDSGARVVVAGQYKLRSGSPIVEAPRGAAQ